MSEKATEKMSEKATEKTTEKSGAPSSSTASPPPAGPRTANLAGVKLHPTGRTFEVDAGQMTLRAGQRVVVQGERGSEVATVSVASAPRPASGHPPRVLRLADDRDLERLEATRRRAADALAFGRDRARARQLGVKMFRAELHPGNRATFYFASENRVDFRELVRDLSSELRLRVELRQVGVRDEAKMVGGIGSCGRELCCSTFLPRFAPVSIKMAKHQNLVLNPTKVSGQCGRLKCCLVYEEANYVEAAKLLPKVGKRVTTPAGVGRVGDLDVLGGKVRVYFQDGPPHVFRADEVKTIAPPGGPGGPPPPEPESDPGDDPPPGLPHN